MESELVVERYQLGSGPLEVSPIGLGCWQFSQATGVAGRYWGRLPRETVRQIVAVSLQAGVNWFDTAEVYGWGASENELSEALKYQNVKPTEVVIASKWFPLFRSAASIKKTIGRRLSALGGFPIDLYQIHFAGSWSSIERQMDAMADLVHEGKIRAVGVSNFSASQMRRAHAALSKREIPLASNQVKYSLLDRDIEHNGVLEAAQELGVSIIAYSPLAQGLLTGKFHDNPSLIRSRPGPRKLQKRFRESYLKQSAPVIESLREIAARHEVRPAQIALAWVVQSQGRQVIAIPGATKIRHAESNAAALRVRLSESEIEELNRVTRG